LRNLKHKLGLGDSNDHGVTALRSNDFLIANGSTPTATMKTRSAVTLRVFCVSSWEIEIVSDSALKRLVDLPRQPQRAKKRRASFSLSFIFFFLGRGSFF
jgi:hypothetical protein